MHLLNNYIFDKLASGKDEPSQFQSPNQIYFTYFILILNLM